MCWGTGGGGRGSIILLMNSFEKCSPIWSGSSPCLWRDIFGRRARMSKSHREKNLERWGDWSLWESWHGEVLPALRKWTSAWSSLMLIITHGLGTGAIDIAISTPSTTAFTTDASAAQSMQSTATPRPHQSRKQHARREKCRESNDT